MRFLLSLTVLLYTSMLCAQDKAINFGVLKQANEEVVFGFVLKKGDKTALLCKEKNNKYLVYRFGTKENIELVYPPVLDKSSWKQFEYSGYSRGGGIENLAMGDYSLSFINNNVVYELYENWSSEENNVVHLGINIIVNKKSRELPGNENHRWGTLDELRFLENYIPNKER